MTKSAIVIVVDRLGCGHLGPYGNTWVPTPHWNQFAGESLLYEFAISDSPELETVYRSYWQGLHAMRPVHDRQASLAELLLDAGIELALVTDEREVAEHALAAQIPDVATCEPSNPCIALRPEHTQIARTFATGIEQIASTKPPALMWIHAQGMNGPWDAPRSFREQFVDEEDPEPPHFIEPPNYRLEPDHDPDEVLGVSCAYSGQVVLLDICLGALLDELSAMPQHEESLVIVASPRGFPLAEHLRVGACDDALYSELIHVPWIMRTPDSVADSARNQLLVQPPDMYATLLDWFGIEAPNACDGRSLLSQSAFVRQRVCSVASDQAAIRTPAWMMQCEGQRRELYVKPDDRCEVNDVADRCPEIVTWLDEAAAEFKLAAERGTLDTLPPLRDALVQGLD